MLKKNDVLQVTVEDINHLGMGVAKRDGAVIFVRGGVTGDVLNIKIIKVAKDYLVAIISDIITPSPYRAEPECPAFKRCGGCVYSHISFDYENNLKRQRVENEFRRFGMTDIEVLPTIYANERAYRNKLQCPVAENGEMGFYAQKSHDIIPLSCCSLQEDLTAPIFEFLSGYFKAHPIPSIKHVYLRCGKATGEVMVCFVCKNKSFKEESSLAGEIVERFKNVKSVILNHNPKDTNVILGDKCRVIWGSESITDILCGLTFVISPLAFYQVNHDCTELLYSAAAKAANIQPSETVCDLFCGIGTVGLCINAMTPAKKLIGVEIIPEAIENAKQNAALNGVDNAEFYCSAAEDFRFERPDVLIVDPPRKGLAPKLVEYIGSLLPDRIVYISCSPDTLARDCDMLMKYGYTFKDVQPVNMFPRTAHVECVVCLTRTFEN